MGLCGSFRCGCGVTSTPATEGAVGGELPTINVTGSGEPGDPYDLTLNDAWAVEVADALTALTDDALEVVEGDYTPTLTNIAVGTGGSATNTAHYKYVGQQGVGGTGIITITTNLVLGTSGASVSGAAILSMPPGFEFDIAVTSGQTRLGFVTLGSSPGVVQYNALNQFAYNALNAASTYLAVATVSATVPLTWAAGDAMRASFTAQVIRV